MARMPELFLYSSSNFPSLKDTIRRAPGRKRIRTSKRSALPPDQKNGGISVSVSVAHTVAQRYARNSERITHRVWPQPQINREFWCSRLLNNNYQADVATRFPTWIRGLSMPWYRRIGTPTKDAHRTPSRNHRGCAARIPKANQMQR